MLHPYDQDPPAGWIGHANQRSLPRGYGMQLSSTWYYPNVPNAWHSWPATVATTVAA